MHGGTSLPVTARRHKNGLKARRKQATPAQAIESGVSPIPNRHRLMAGRISFFGTDRDSDDVGAWGDDQPALGVGHQIAVWRLDFRVDRKLRATRQHERASDHEQNDLNRFLRIRDDVSQQRQQDRADVVLRVGPVKRRVGQELRHHIANGKQ